jgi:hypothetical protein
VSHTVNPSVFRLGKSLNWNLLSSPLYFSRNFRFKLVLNSLLFNFLNKYNYKLVKYAYCSEKFGLKIFLIAFRQVLLLRRFENFNNIKVFKNKNIHAGKNYRYSYFKRGSFQNFLKDMSGGYDTYGGYGKASYKPIFFVVGDRLSEYRNYVIFLNKRTFRKVSLSCFFERYKSREIRLLFLYRRYKFFLFKFTGIKKKKSIYYDFKRSKSFFRNIHKKFFKSYYANDLLKKKLVKKLNNKKAVYDREGNLLTFKLAGQYVVVKNFFFNFVKVLLLSWC